MTDARKAWIALVAAAFVSLATLAVAFGVGAAPDRSSDGNDTRGPLDVRTVERIGNSKPRWTIITFREWRIARMFDSGFFVVYLDTFGTRRYDYYALVRSKGTKLSGTLWRDRRRKDDVRVGFVDSFRRDQRSVAVRVPLRKVKMPDTRYFYYWQARTIFTGPHCTQVCIDVVPNQGGEQVLVRPSPTPTPTLTPTFSPLPSPTET